MLVLAFVPGVSVLTVSARAVSHGFVHGIVAILGIVLGDIIFISIAILGLSFLIDTLDELYVLLKYVGGAYLIWLGLVLMMNKSPTERHKVVIKTSYLSSFLAGLLITLADQKAILFYLVFFPAFVDVSILSYGEIGMIIALAATAIFIAKLGYAYMAVKAKLLITNRVYQVINLVAGMVLIIVGMVLALKT